MRVVGFYKYIEIYDDTEFAFIVADNNGDVVAYVQYLCGNRPNYNRPIAMHCTPEKFERIIAPYKNDRQITHLFDELVETQQEADRLINDAYTNLRKEKGLEADWFNGHGL